MADVHTKEIGSYNMSRIKSRNTKPEMLVRRFLHANGFLYKLHDKSLPDKPDIVLPKYKTVIFVHGCFWHGHDGCKYYVIPKTRTDWWLNKINGNIVNDSKAIKALKRKKMGELFIFRVKLPQPERTPLTLFKKRILNKCYQIGSNVYICAA